MIDIFSRYGWVEPLKDKTANEIVKAFDKILQEGRIPKRLHSDSAKDFVVISVKRASVKMSR